MTTWEEMSCEERARWARECLSNPAFIHAMDRMKDSCLKRILNAVDEPAVLKAWEEHKAMMTVTGTLMHDINIMTRLEGGNSGPNKEFVKRYEKGE